MNCPPGQKDEGQERSPLNECVRKALRNYFRDLDGHKTNGLYDMVIQQVERPLMEAVMNHTGGNQSRAAELLGISRSTLRKKIKQYGLD